MDLLSGGAYVDSLVCQGLDTHRLKRLDWRLGWRLGRLSWRTWSDDHYGVLKNQKNLLLQILRRFYQACT
jgi:hypothetical protein